MAHTRQSRPSLFRQKPLKAVKVSPLCSDADLLGFRCRAKEEPSQVQNSDLALTSKSGPEFGHGFGHLQVKVTRGVPISLGSGRVNLRASISSRTFLFWSCILLVYASHSGLVHLGGVCFAFRARGAGFRVSGLGLRILVLFVHPVVVVCFAFRATASCWCVFRVQGSGRRVQGVRFRVLFCSCIPLLHVSGSGLEAHGSRCKVSGFGVLFCSCILLLCVSGSGLLHP